MRTESDLHDYLRDRNLSATAIEYIRQSWINPSRMIGVHARTNVVSFVPSRKLHGKTYSTESRSPERAFLTLCEFDDDVICALDQPDPIQIERTQKNGNRRRGSYTPDAVILTRNVARVVEVKGACDVENYLTKNPADWTRSESGDVLFLPARKAFAELGLEHVVYVYDHEDRFLVENLDLILQARDQESPVVLDRNSAKKLLRNACAITLNDLRVKLKLKDLTPLIHAIDKGILVADLKKHRLANSTSCLVSLNRDLLEHAIELSNKQRVYWDGLAESGDLQLIPTLKSAEHALKRLKKLQSEYSTRSIRRWKTQVKLGLERDLSEFQALIPMIHLRGNRNRKIPAVVDELLMDYLLHSFAQEQGISIYRGYLRYKDLALMTHPQFNPVSRQTFSTRLDQIPREIIGEARGGKRKRNAMTAPTDPQMRSLKTTIPWQRAAVDHYLADIFLIVFSRSGEVYVERPWVTALVDLATSKILGLCISFCSPSRRSVSKVLRDCVRRHGRLPREIIVDRGADFKSVYMASFMAHYGLILSMRPASYPELGGEVEGFFGEFLKQWLCQRPGNMADYKEVRSVDGNKAPRKAAILQPIDFYEELWTFCEWRENKCRGTGSNSIEFEFSDGSERYPFYAKQISYDSEFITVTAVEDKRYSFSYQKGINIKNIWYYTPALKKLNGRAKKVDVRIDPENPNLIFAKIEDQWEPCYSSEINAYSAKCAAHQLVEGMIKHEASNLRAKIGHQHDLELAKKIRELDEFKKQTKTTPMLDVTILEDEPVVAENIFSHAIGAKLRPINIQKWGHDNG